MHYLHIHRWHKDWREHRILWQHETVSSTLEKGGNTIEKTRNLETNFPGSKEIVDHFVVRDAEEITLENIQSYVKERAAGISDSKHIVSMLDKWLKTKEITSLSPAERAEAERKLNEFMQFLRQCRAEAEGAKEKLKQLHTQGNPEVPDTIEGVYNTAKEHIGKFASGFMDAPLEQKAIMVAGVAATVYIFKKSLEGMNDKLKRALGKTAGLAVAGGVALMGYEAINKTVENTYGRPILNMFGRGRAFPLWGGTQEEWNKAEMADEFDRVYAELQSQNIPMDKLDEIKQDEKERYAFAMANFAGMTTEDFLKLYEQYKGTGLPETAPEYRRSPFRKDYLTDLERIALMQDMGQAVNIIKANGEPESLTETTKKKTIVYLALEQAS